MFVLSFFLVEITSSTFDRFSLSVQVRKYDFCIWKAQANERIKNFDDWMHLCCFLKRSQSLTKTLVSIFEGSSRDSIRAHLPPSRRTFWHFFDIFWCIILLFGFRILDGCPSGAFFVLFALRFTPRLLKMTGMHQCQPLKSR